MPVPRTLAKPPMGFGRGRREGEDRDAIERLFTPEFRNRLDAIVGFRPLSRRTIGRVVDKFIAQLKDQLADRGVAIELTEPARDWLGRRGHDELFGARPLARVIQESIKRPIADALLFGPLAGGGRVRVTVDEEDRLGFEFLPRDRLEPAAGPRRRKARRSAGAGR